MSTKNTHPDRTTSPTTDPGVLEPLAPEFVIGESNGAPVFHDGYSKARAAMESLHGAAGVLLEAEKALAGATLSQSDAERLRRGASSKFEGVRKTMGATLEAIDAHRGEVEKSITETLGVPVMRTSVTDSQRGADVRAALRAMGQTERFAAIRAAINGGDAEAVSAVLAASNLASGFTTNEMSLIRTEAERKFAPRQVRLRDSLSALRGVVERASTSLEHHYGALAGVGGTKAARAERALRALEEVK